MIYCLPLDESLMSQLEKGQTVTVHGKVDVGVFSGQIRVLDCMLVE